MDVGTADSHDAGAAALAHDRYFSPRTSNKTRRRTITHRVRIAARAYAEQHKESGDDRLCYAVGLPCKDGVEQVHPSPGSASTHRHASSNRSLRRTHLERDLRWYHDISKSSSQYRNPRPRAPWRNEENEGLDLARSNVELPSDRARRPSLEREDAFCDASTYKCKGIRVRSLATPPRDEDAQIAELYRMGLLYDDEVDASQQDLSFNLDKIHHNEPVYTIRHAKRSRKGGKGGKSMHATPLNLDLSFADLGNDDDIARYLQSPAATESDETLQQGVRRQHTPPLRVIYELSSAKPSFDVDTSQPPDLMEDDYDCFSDSELDDGPSQREVKEGATPGSEAWIILGEDGS